MKRLHKRCLRVGPEIKDLIFDPGMKKADACGAGCTRDRPFSVMTDRRRERFSGVGCKLHNIIPKYREKINS